MRGYFSLIFWGLILTIVDFSIDGFDLFADGIGYLVIAAGCRGLTSYSNGFLIAQRICFVLAVFWLLGFAVGNSDGVAIGLAVLVVDCLMMWHLLGGTSEYALKRYRPELAQSAQSRRVAYCGITIAIWLTMFVVNTAGDSGFWITMLSFAAFVVLIMILSLIYRIKLIAS